MLEVRNIAFAYRKATVLRDVSFVVSPGEVVTIVGSNGAGKTTLIKILATLFTPDAGQVLADGLDAFTRPLKYRSQIGYLSEVPAIYEDMTVKEYLNYRAHLKGESIKRVRRRVGDAVEMCRILDIMRTRVGSLSLGLKKRVALADALLLRPRILLLDDFLSGLDTNLRSSSGEILSDAAAFSSVIVTGHELNDFVKWTTRFLVLNRGVVSNSIATAGVGMAELKSRLCSALAEDSI